MQPSLRRADLRGACFSGADLTGADLTQADLREGAITTVDRDLGLRSVDARREANATSMAGANLERSQLGGIIAMRADLIISYHMEVALAHGWLAL